MPRGEIRVPRLVVVLACASFLTVLAAALPGVADEVAYGEQRCVFHCDCPAGSLCQASGFCEVAACPEVFAPVCGLDGNTYPNACAAQAAHVVVARPGECGQRCGGIQGLGCPDGEICDLPPRTCSGADFFGECKPRPRVCTKDYRPVCGCDGRTYGNDCTRLAAGAQKDHDGACGAPCADNDACGEGDFCEFSPGRCRQPGQCAARPESCTFELAPVCGCDGNTYANACQAAAAGVSVLHHGSCSA